MMTKRFKDDYEIVVTTDEAGREKEEAVYLGEYFQVALDEEGLRSFKRKSLLLAAAAAVLHIAAGFISNWGMYQVYVVFPYVFVFFPLLYLVDGILYLPREQRAYRRDEVELSFGRMKVTSRIVLALLCVGALGEVIFLLLFMGDGKLVFEALFFVLEVLAAGAVYMLIRLQKDFCIENAEQ